MSLGITRSLSFETTSPSARAATWKRRVITQTSWSDGRVHVGEGGRVGRGGMHPKGKEPPAGVPRGLRRVLRLAGRSEERG